MNIDKLVSYTKAERERVNVAYVEVNFKLITLIDDILFKKIKANCWVGL